MSLREDQALRILSEVLPATYRSRKSRVRVGLGDDAAIIAGGTSEDIWTVDSCEEGTHFLWEWMTPEDIAHKSLQSALSDVAAMGAKPRGVLCHLTLSERVTAKMLRRFAMAQAEQCRGASVPLVGGNLSWGQKFGVVTTALGESPVGGALLRTGASPGDELWLVGEIGLARAGLLLLQAGRRKTTARAEARCLSAFRRPCALLSEGTKLSGRATSCLDVSDGLAKDAGELSAASGVRVIVDAELLQASLTDELQQAAGKLDEGPLQLALQGGEDYALLATGASKKRPRFARVIGRIERGSGAVLVDDGKQRSLRGGFVHGKS